MTFAEAWKATLNNIDEESKRFKPMSDMFESVRKMYANRTDDFNRGDIKDLMTIVGPGATNLPFDYDDDWTDDMVQEYADNLYNYLYNYTDDVHSVDETIDTEEKHRGPMAQDIEKVAPDCVTETSSGIKTVDGDRLALVNAGVIGELSRRVIDLEKEVKDLKEKLYG